MPTTRCGINAVARKDEWYGRTLTACRYALPVGIEFSLLTAQVPHAPGTVLSER